MRSIHQYQRVTVRIREDILKMVDLAAKEVGVSRNEAVNGILEKSMQVKGDKNPLAKYEVIDDSRTRLQLREYIGGVTLSRTVEQRVKEIAKNVAREVVEREVGKALNKRPQRSSRVKRERNLNGVQRNIEGIVENVAGEIAKREVDEVLKKEVKQKSPRRQIDVRVIRQIQPQAIASKAIPSRVVMSQESEKKKPVNPLMMGLIRKSCSDKS